MSLKISIFAIKFQILKLANMPHCKVTRKISELQENFSSNQLKSSIVFQTLHSLKLSANFSEFDNLKKQGYSVNHVLSLLIWMTTRSIKTVNASLSELFDNGIFIGKDVFYRLINSEKICWRRILWYIVSKFLKQTKKEADKTCEKSSSTKPRCLIFDDTLIEKTGNKTEKIGKVYDHVKHRMVLGFKLLVGMYFDGTSAIPIDFSIVREKGKNTEKPFGMSKKHLRQQLSKKRTKESEGIKRVKELDVSKIKLSIQLFLRTILHGIPVDYVLCDSWFTCLDLIRTVREKGCHLIGMYKFVTTKFVHNGKKRSYKQILHFAGKEIRCKKLNLYYKTAHVKYDDIPVTLFFSKIGTNGNWKVF
jgi:hypothetical protein